MCVKKGVNGCVCAKYLITVFDSFVLFVYKSVCRCLIIAAAMYNIPKITVSIEMVFSHVIVFVNFPIIPFVLGVFVLCFVLFLSKLTVF